MPAWKNRTWQVAMQAQLGKQVDQNKCEDAIVSNGYYAVIDGATDKSGLIYTLDDASVSAGKFASKTVAKALSALPLGLNPIEAIASLSNTLNEAILAQHPEVDSMDRPNALLMVFDPSTETVWGIGDTMYGFKKNNGGVEEHLEPLEVDKLLSTMRRLFHKALEDKGEPWNPLDGSPDPSREAIMPFLKIQGLLANTVGPFGYGLLNGLPVPEKYIRVQHVPSNVSDVYLASDGYPCLIVNNDIDYEVSENTLMTMLALDPLCLGPLAGTKGLVDGNLAHDDRSWLHLQASDTSKEPYSFA